MLSFHLTPADLQAFSFAFLFFFTGLAAFFIFTTNYKDRVARAFGWAILFAALINIFAFLYHTTEHFELARMYRLISQFFVIPFTYCLVEFAHVMHEVHVQKRAPNVWLGNALSLLLLAFTPLFILDFFGHQFLIGTVTVSPSILLTPDPGPYFIFFIVSFLFAIMYALGCIAKVRELGVSKPSRVQGLLVLMFFGIPILTRVLSYLPWYGVEVSSVIGSFLTAPIFSIGVTYAILRHKVFNLRLVAAEVFIFIFWSFIFFRVLLADSFIEALPDLILLVATMVLGIFLIRSLLKEAEQKEKLERAGEALRALNQTLERRVEERTEALARASTHLEAMLEHLPSGIIETDERGFITRINRAAERLLGVSRTEVVGRRPKQDSNLARVVDANEGGEVQAKASSERHEADIVLEVGAASPRYLTVSTVGIALDSGRKGFIKLIRDVTRERLIDRAKSEFISIAAHQLRTPIAALRWSFNLLLGGEAGRVSKTQREILSRGNEGAENMVRLINDLLNAARIAEGKFSYDMREGSLPDVVRKVADLFDAQMKGKNISFSFSRGKKLPLVRFDEEKISIAFQNLIDNAVKYTPQGGEVRIEMEERGGRIFVAIRDTGIGISKADQGRLFEKFFRSKKATQMFTDGSGLGLFIVKTIVDAHGGSISIHSEESKGTTVILSFPTASGEQEE